jgi:hypothetical protein
MIPSVNGGPGGSRWLGAIRPQASQYADVLLLGERGFRTARRSPGWSPWRRGRAYLQQACASSRRDYANARAGQKLCGPPNTILDVSFFITFPFSLSWFLSAMDDNYCGIRAESRRFDYFFNDSLLSSQFRHFRGGFWGVDWPFGGSGGVGPFGISGTGWPFGALVVGWPFSSLVVDWPFGVLGGLRPRDFGISLYLMRAWGLG